MCLDKYFDLYKAFNMNLLNLLALFTRDASSAYILFQFGPSVTRGVQVGLFKEEGGEGFGPLLGLPVQEGRGW